jgi:hypothetical protein
MADKVAQFGGTTTGLTDLNAFERFIDQDRVAAARQVLELNLSAE